jgi:hypothetical protein
MHMSIEEALLARARPHMVTARKKEIFLQEISKGCRPEISPDPVALEPVYRPIVGLRHLAVDDMMTPWVIEPSVPMDRLVRFKLWISPKQKCDWLRSELFIKQLSRASHRIVFEIVGNRWQVGFYILCHRDDYAVVRTPFRGQFELCELTPCPVELLQETPAGHWDEMVFGEWFPPPPYSHLLTRPDELKRSPYATLITALAEIPAPAIGIYQVVFAPVSPTHNWHQNVEDLLDTEYELKLWSGASDPGRYLQQPPSSPLNTMAGNVVYKAHSDKPFYSAVLRIGLLDGREYARQLLQGLAVVAGLIQHGGRPLYCLTDEQYRRFLPNLQIKRMFVEGLTHRPGFLLNSCELVSLVHIPPPETVEHIKTPMTRLEPLPPGPALTRGTPIGVCHYADRIIPVCIPADFRCTHFHMIGKPGQGKSTVMEHMFLYEIGRGDGVIVLDPHGRLVQRLLRLIPREHAERVIYFNPGNPDWVPLWNPIQRIPGQDLGRTADDLVNAFKKIVTNWGDRLEELLRQTFYAALNMTGCTLLDVSSMLHNKTKESDVIRGEVLQVIDNAVARQFWVDDYKRYGKDDLGPPRNKLGKLLMSETVSLMLSQPECAFRFREVMEEGGIVLVDLSQVSAQVCELLGCFMLELLRLTALTRDGLEPGSLRPFHIYCDEAHRFLTDAMEGLIAETRKFNVSLTLAHQYMSQFNTKQADALASVGSSIIFNVDTKDAQFLRKDLQNLVEVDDLITQEVGHTIARIGTEVVRVRTHDALKIPKNNCRDLIIANSHRKYYRPIAEIRRLVRERSRRWTHDAHDLDNPESESASGTHRTPPQGPAPSLGIGHDVF